jgi:hypothetical protein
MVARADSLLHLRTRALATMYLTRRDDLSLRFDENGSGLDLVVDIIAAKAHGDHRGRRMFGVQLNGARAPLSLEQAQKQLNSAFKGKKRVPKLPFPLCLFLFTMADDTGYFTWLIEPAIRNGSAKLRTVGAGRPARVIDNAALNEIVECVNSWYDVFYSTISV